MFVRCANPKCQNPRRSYCQGRLFQFEIVAISVAASDEKSEPFDEKPERTITHFWLCDNCAAKMNLELDPKQGLRLIPISQKEHRKPAASSPAKVQPRDHC